MDGSSNLWRPLQSWLNLHPEYKQEFENTVNQMLYDVDGPLPLHHRQFLALMAASRHRCRFLIDLHKAEFVRFGGDPSWLEEGIRRYGGKLAQLDVLNRILAHQPWTLQSHHLQDLTRCESGSAESGNMTWSLSELVHGAVILCHTHALCSFIIGSGITHGCASPQLKPHNVGLLSGSHLPPGKASEPLEPEVGADEDCVVQAATTAEQDANNEVQLLMRRMAEMRSQADVNQDELARHFQDMNIQSSQLSDTSRASASGTGGQKQPKSPTKTKSLSNKRSLESEADLSGSAPFDCSAVAAAATSQTQTPPASTPPPPPDEPQPSFDDVRPNGVCVDTPRSSSSNNAPGQQQGSSSSTPSLYTNEPAFAYVDFAARTERGDAPTLKIHDYSWDDQGYSVVSQLYHQLGDHLEHKFQIIQSLTYNTMGEHEGVDTSKYRQAIWNYIQSLYGIRHDDYHYAEVNALLSIPMKTYIKTMACFPERTSAQLRDSVMQDFQYSEKVHVNVLVAEGRLQAELLYFLRAVTRLML